MIVNEKTSFYYFLYTLTSSRPLFCKMRPRHHNLLHLTAAPASHGLIPTYGARKIPDIGRRLGFLCFRYTIDEHITAFDFCNLLFRFVFVRNLASRFNQIAHDLIELRSAF